MARVKTEKELEQTEKTVETTETQETKTETTKEADATTKETDAAAETETIEEEAQEEIPSWVDKVLKSFSNFDELYVTKSGGVLSKNTPKHLVTSATLYKNPYYKK